MATPKKKAAPKKRPAASKRPTTTQQLEQLSKKMEEMTQTYQQELLNQQQRYNDLVDQAQKQMAALVGASQPKPPPKPQAVWHEEGGEKLLVLNQAAADFFTKIFENVGVLADALQKQMKEK